MPAGRPRKPIDVLELQGTVRHHRHGDPEAYFRPDGEPEKPELIADDEFASEMWDRIVPDLSSSGVAAEIDWAELTCLCEWWSRYRAVTVILKQKTPEDEGYYRLQILAGAAWKNFSNIASRFGLTPADRSRLGMVGGKKESEQDKLASFIAQKGA